MAHGHRMQGFAFSVASAGRRSAHVGLGLVATRNHFAGELDNGVACIPKGLPTALDPVDCGLGSINARGNACLAPTRS